MSGSESDESLKISFADAWNEISEVIADGEVEIKCFWVETIKYV